MQNSRKVQNLIIFWQLKQFAQLQDFQIKLQSFACKQWTFSTPAFQVFDIS
jgi:hypothetical protein